MVKVEQALKIVLENLKILPSQDIKLTDALNRVIREDIYADVDIPQLDNSAMDGYAVRSEDTKGASFDNPKVLEVIEDLRTGNISEKTITENQAIRISTGGIIPEGADSVIMVEFTEGLGMDKVKIFREVKPGGNIRRKGEDIKKGELVISNGTLLRTSHIGILASLGKAKVKVTEKPKVAILATGDELINLDEELRPGKVRSANSYSLYSQVIKSGAIPLNLGIARDDAKDLEQKIEKGLNANLILTSGGVSVGKYDLVKSVLERLGMDLKFHKVAMRPGRPLLFGIIKGIPFFGLPGNPVSSMVGFEIFVKPAIWKILGRKTNDENEIEAILEEDIKKKRGFKYFLRAVTEWSDEKYFTRTTGPQGSGILKSMILVNSLMILPEEEEFIKKGTKVKVRFLD
jgi:molybdopterin molybdotransferase